MKKKSNIYKITLTALFAAIVCVATIVVQIPTPTKGYMNLGDCFVLLSVWMLGLPCGTLAAGVGSMLADVFSGYMVYAPATFVIKSLMAVAAYFVIKGLKATGVKKYDLVCRIISGIAAEAVMVIGYFLYESVILDNKWAAALSGVPMNVLQGATGIVASVIIFIVLNNTGALKKISVFDRM